MTIAVVMPKFKFHSHVHSSAYRRQQEEVEESTHKHADQVNQDHGMNFGYTGNCGHG